MTDERDPEGEDEKDELDPSDWLASQFDPTSTVPLQRPVQPAPPVPPVQPGPPVPPLPPAAPVPPQPTTPSFPSAPDVPPAPPAPPVTPPPATEPPPLVEPPAPSFTWNLQPGADIPAVPVPPPAAAPTPPVPPTPATPPPPVVPDFPPTVSIPPADVPTQAFTLPELAETSLSSQELEPRQWEPWQARPVDASLDGATEVIEAEIIGLEGPEGESNPQSPIDDLFGDNQFQDYEGEPLLSGPPPSSPGTRAKPTARAPMPRTQKILFWVAGSLVALLALLALFMLGQRLASAPTAAPSSTPTATPTPEPTVAVPQTGPVPPGEYEWDQLLGGECLAPFESAWQERYTVVDCGTPHPAQMLVRGQFDDASDAAYPGFDELTKRIGLLCTTPAVINYQVAGTAQDIQVAASFAVDEADWTSGNRTYFCFANRASGADLTASIAVPQATP